MPTKQRNCIQNYPILLLRTTTLPPYRPKLSTMDTETFFGYEIIRLDTRLVDDRTGTARDVTGGEVLEQFLAEKRGYPNIYVNTSQKDIERRRKYYRMI
jgi:hypothetical protein